MPSTYTLISSNVLSSSAASVTFSAIPSTYTDLVLRISARNSDTGRADVYLTVNGSGSSIYSATNVRGTGAAASSASYSAAAQFSFLQADSSSNTANTFGSLEIYIPNYLASANKPMSAFGVQEDNSASTNAWIVANAMLFSSTTAISSLTMANAGAVTFNSGSSFYLYGIKNS